MNLLLELLYSNIYLANYAGGIEYKIMFLTFPSVNLLR